MFSFYNEILVAEMVSAPFLFFISHNSAFCFCPSICYYYYFPSPFALFVFLPVCISFCEISTVFFFFFAVSFFCFCVSAPVFFSVKKKRRRQSWNHIMNMLKNPQKVMHHPKPQPTYPPLRSLPSLFVLFLLLCLYVVSFLF